MESAMPAEGDLRAQAIRRLRKKHGFRRHAFIYVAVNAFLIGIWALTGAGFFWPVFPILGWGIGLAAHAWDVYGHKEISEDAISREAERLRR